MKRRKFRDMKCRQVGHSGLWVSEVGLGLWKWGDPSYDGSRVGEHEGFKILDRALELGVFFLDTANSYNWGSGNSERLIGRYFASRGRCIREQVVLATKIANPVRAEYEEKADFTPNQRGASRLYIRRAVEGCLRRLQTDYIDLLYIHYPVVDKENMRRRWRRPGEPSTTSSQMASSATSASPTITSGRWRRLGRPYGRWPKTPLGES
jgi:aryl-alcohol dehydrogenase-like predicted oxidoreductase